LGSTPRRIANELQAILMAEAKEFPPREVRAIVSEVAALLKERKETVSVAETVCPDCFLF
jgi:hypothetical protein